VINSPVNIHFSGVGREDGSHVVPMEIHPRDRDVLSARRNDHPIAGVDRIAEFKADLAARNLDVGRLGADFDLSSIAKPLSMASRSDSCAKTRCAPPELLATTYGEASTASTNDHGREAMFAPDKPDEPSVIALAARAHL
jgi:hypothetical protein